MANSFPVGNQRQFAFYNPTAGYMDTANATTDWTKLGAIALQAIGGQAIDAGGGRVAGVGTPTASDDAATKAYVDGLVQGAAWKPAVHAASIGNVSLSAPGAAIDGVTLAALDRVLLKDQTAVVDNGVWVWTGAAVAMTRASDLDSSADFPSAAVFVEEGTTNGDSGWVSTSNPGFVLGTTPNFWAQFTGLGSVTAGVGLTKNGNTLSVGKGDGVAVGAGAVSLALSANPGLTLAGTSPNKTLAWLPDANRGLSMDATGAYISIAGSLQFSGGALAVKVDPAGAVVAGGSGLAVALAGTPGLVLAGNTLGVKVPASKGLTLDVTGVYVGLAGSNPGLQYSGAAGLDTKIDPASGLVTNASGLAVALTSNAGLQFSTGTLGVKVDGARGITAAAAGIGLNLAGTPGLSLAGNALAVLSDPNGGIQVGAAGASVKLNGATLAVGASGLSVAGVPNLFTINGFACGESVTTNALNNVTNGSIVGTLHQHNYLLDVVTADAAIAQGQAVYYTGPDSVSPGSCNTAGKDNIIGVAAYSVALGATVSIYRAGTAAWALSFATLGAAYYLGSTGMPVLASALQSGNRVIRLGYASNYTSLDVRIEDVGVRP